MANVRISELTKIEASGVTGNSTILVTVDSGIGGSQKESQQLSFDDLFGSTAFSDAVVAVEIDPKANTVAATALTTANTAVTNAATADAKAVAAQTDATQALADSSTAQTTADSAVTNAATNTQAIQNLSISSGQQVADANKVLLDSGKFLIQRFPSGTTSVNTLRADIAGVFSDGELGLIDGNFIYFDGRANQTVTLDNGQVKAFINGVWRHVTTNSGANVDDGFPV